MINKFNHLFNYLNRFHAEKYFADLKEAVVSGRSGDVKTYLFHYA